MSATTRRARKPHRCTLCGRSIPAGTYYRYQRITPWDHPDNEGFFDYRAHHRCDEFWHAEYADGCDDLFPIGEECEFRRECWRWQVRRHRAFVAFMAQPAGAAA